MSSRPHTGLIGAAGEYHVAAQLSMRGWLATVTIKNAPGTDVLAQHLDMGTLVAIQTKTTSSSGDSLVLGLKDERPAPRDNEWYVFVVMKGVDARPDFFVMPRDHVSALLYVGHRNWLAQPGRGGAQRKDNSMRNVFPAEIQPYREDWDSLLAPPSQRAYELPPWFDEKAPVHGYPPGHPRA